MAEKPLSTSRRTLLGGAAALPLLTLIPSSARPEPVERRALWDRRLASYRRLAAATEEAAERGWLCAAYERYDRERAEIAARYGTREDTPELSEARTLRRAAFERVDRAEEAFWEQCTAPTQHAAVALALTP